MNFRQLHYICTVADHCNISKAAKALMISQPSLSNFIAKTEKTLGVRLFERSASAPLKLTYAGERFVAHARKILMQSNSMLREMSDISGSIAGRIVLGFPHERLSYMAPAILPKYKQLYPQIELKFETANGTALLDHLQTGQIDIAVLPHCKGNAVLETVDLFEETLYLITGGHGLPDEYLSDSVNRKLEPAKLGDLDFILLHEGHVMRIFMDEYFESLGIEPKVILETSSNLASYKLAASGLGATVVPQTTVALAREEPNACICDFAKWTVRAFYRKTAYFGEPERNLIEVMKEAF